jgi:hypothetical protein
MQGRTTSRWGWREVDGGGRGRLRHGFAAAPGAAANGVFDRMPRNTAEAHCAHGVEAVGLFFFLGGVGKGLGIALSKPS